MVRTTTNVKAYVSREERKQEEERKQQSQSINYQRTDLSLGIVEEDVEYDELFSDFSEYILNDETRIYVKTILNQINKTIYFTQDGEPIYSVSIVPSIKIKKKPMLT